MMAPWEYEFTDTGITVYDSSGSQIGTVSNDGSGIKIPDDVLDVMFDQALNEYRNGNVEEALTIVAIMAGEQIEEQS